MDLLSELISEKKEKSTTSFSGSLFCLPMEAGRRETLAENNRKALERVMQHFP